MKVNISTDDVDRAIDEEFDDIDDALDEAAKDLREEGRDAAKDHIRKHDRVWNREVLNGWTPVQMKSNIGSVKMYGFNNSAEHARIVDRGAEFTDEKPPIDALMPYVRQNMIPGPDQTWEDLAFMVQRSIYRDGIEGIRFTTVAKGVMDARAESVVHEKIGGM